MTRLRGLFILDPTTFELVYGPEECQAIARHAEMVAPPQTRTSIIQNTTLLKSVEVIFSGWGAPIFNEAFFEHAPKLKAIFYAAGPIGIADIAARHGVVVCTSHHANSIPVAEYTLATILFSLKHGWRLSRQTRQLRQFVDRNAVPGCYGTTVGLISLGAIARILLKLLAPFDLNILVYDPLLEASEAAELGVEKTPLGELFHRSDVISLHTPVLPETKNMIRGSHFASMKRGATFINTARGIVVREDEMIDVAKRRPDLQFVLDVTDPVEPPQSDSPLYDLPNVVLTPHIAGSAGGECRRLGRYMVGELERFVRGEPLKWVAKPMAPERHAQGPAIKGPPTIYSESIG